MRLISCYVENFGRLHDYSVRFSEGINTICQENGWGKSTFAAFVRAMFYGLEGERKRSLLENERKKYMPWQGGVFGGTLVFEIQGKEYVISRVFHDKEANDEFELRDAKSNLLSGDYSKNIGEEIFKINRESFMNTVFIGQGCCETSVTDDINAKMGNLTEDSKDINRYNAAYESLTTLINRWNPDRVTGSIAKRKEEIGRYEKLYRDGQHIAESIEKYRMHLRNEEAAYEELRDKWNEVGEQQAKADELQLVLAKKEEWERRKQAVRLQKEELEGRLQRFPRAVPETEEIRKVITECSEMELCKERATVYSFSETEGRAFSELSSLFPNDVPTETEFEIQYEKLKKQFPVMLPGAILAIMGVLLAMTSSLTWGAIMIGSAVILVMIGAFYNRKKAIRLEEFYLLRNNAEKYLTLRDKQKNFQREENGYRSLRESIDEYLLGYGYEPSDNLYVQLNNISKEIEEYQNSVNLLAEQMRELARFEKENAGMLLEDRTEKPLPSLQELNQTMLKLTAQMENSHKKILSYNKALEELQEQYEEWEENRLILERLKTLQSEEQKKYDLVCQTRKKLAMAKETMTQKYTDPVMKGFRRYFGMISGKGAEAFRMDANATVTVDTLGKQREITVLSSGYRDLIGICLRLALVEVMYQEEVPVLILDDPFAELDDEKVTAAMVFLSSVAETYQIIYFTCSKHRSS